MWDDGTHKKPKNMHRRSLKDVDHLWTENIVFMMIYTVCSGPGDVSISAHPTIGWCLMVGTSRNLRGRIGKTRLTFFLINIGHQPNTMAGVQ